MIPRLYYASASWAVVGLAGGLYYRTVSQHSTVPGMSTQLAVVHTHALTLGALWLLAVMALARVYTLENNARLHQFFVTWNLGLVLTVGTMIVKGTMQLQRTGDPDGKLLTSIAGIGHITLTVAMTLLFLALAQALPPRAPARTVVSTDPAAPTRES